MTINFVTTLNPPYLWRKQ